MSKKDIGYAVSFVGILTVLVCAILWLQNQVPPDDKPQAPTVAEITQLEWVQEVKDANGRSVLVFTEKIGDDHTPLIVRHYARWTEVGTIEWWTEQVKGE